ncbi:MAG: transposase [Salinivirgaceae bacterium]|nr:MAG: transposase [Salinivirgaceae bacterium]
MSRNYKFHDQELPYFVTLTTVKWIDVFTRPIYKNIFLDSLTFCMKEKGLIIYAWVLMSNHAHLIIGTKKEKLQDILRDFKKFTAKSIINDIKNNSQESRKSWMVDIFLKEGQKNSNNKKYQFWQQHNHPIMLDNNLILEQKLNYLHKNPVKAEIVENEWEYKYSSAIDYSGGRGIIDITFIN